MQFMARGHRKGLLDHLTPALPRNCFWLECGSGITLSKVPIAPALPWDGLQQGSPRGTFGQ